MTDMELQRRYLYCVVVPGKSARFAVTAVDRLVPACPGRLGEPCHLPMTLVRGWVASGVLELRLRQARTGNYRRLVRCLTETVEGDLDLRACTVGDLEAVHGVGPKTARFFLTWTRSGTRMAVLDVHVLRWLRGVGYSTAPLRTPQSRREYRFWESVFLLEADIRGVTPDVLDRQVWGEASRWSEWQDRFDRSQA